MIRAKKSLKGTINVGTKIVYPDLIDLDVTPTKETQSFNHDGVYGYDKVNVNPIPDEYIIPDGTLDITENGTHDVKLFSRVRSAVYPAPNLQDKSVEITENKTTNIVADDGFDGLGNVEVVTNIPVGTPPPTKGLVIDEFDADGYVIKMTLVGFDTIPNDLLNVSSNNSMFNTRINEIAIKGNPTSIGQGAFNSSKMKKTNIPDSVKTIANYTYSGCQYLNLEKLPDNLTSIGREAFYELGFWVSDGIGLKTIPDGVTELQEATFRRCTNLRQISMRNVKTIYSSYGNGGCFANTGLYGIWIGSAIQTIQPYAFAGCTYVKKFFIDLPRATVEAMANYNVKFSNNTISADKIICNDDEEFMTKEEFDSIDWSTQ